MSSPSIEELYKCYEIVNGDEKEETKKIAYEKILDGVKGDEKEKRLSSQFISKFFKLFPDLYEVSFNKLLDLCEDDNVMIRKQVIQYLPTVGKSVTDYLPKIADTLTQMLVAEDNSEIQLIYAALNNVLKVDFKVALEAIFNQLLTQLEEASELINTFAFKYLNEKLGSDCELSSEMETFIETSAKKLLIKLVGKEEYSLVIGILSFLKVNSTLVGRQKLVNEISEQTKLLGKIDEPSKFTTLIANCKQTVKLLSKNVHADDLLMYVLENVADIAMLAAANVGCSLYDLLKCAIDFANRGKNSETDTQVSTLSFSGEGGLKCLQELYQVGLQHLPSMPDEINEEVIGKLSEDKAKIVMQEVCLLAMYYLCRFRPESLGQGDDQAKEFKQRLQFLARVNQASTKAANEVAGKIAPKERLTDECREKLVFSRVTSNLQVLIREFFKTPPSFKTLVIPSWAVPLDQAPKRPSTEPINAGPAKSRLSLRRNGNKRRGGRH